MGKPSDGLGQESYSAVAVLAEMVEDETSRETSEVEPSHQGSQNILVMWPWRKVVRLQYGKGVHWLGLVLLIHRAG